MKYILVMYSKENCKMSEKSRKSKINGEIHCVHGLDDLIYNK